MSKGKDWALILGASSGFGAAIALELARSGFDIFGVHLDSRSTLPNAQRVIDGVKATGREAVFFNRNAADAGKRAAILDGIAGRLAQDGDDASIRVFVHSLAFGTLVSYIADSPRDAVTLRQMEMTLDVMANSLVYWVQDLVARRLLRSGGRVFAMTSAGATRVMKWYGPVSAAKAALESHIRQLALELAPLSITVNAIRAGATDTPALRRIPGGPELLAQAAQRNPSGRATKPEDAARAIAALSDERLYWMTGNVIGVDGGEDITG